jgi:hypothetical protein
MTTPKLPQLIGFNGSFAGLDFSGIEPLQQFSFTRLL